MFVNKEKINIPIDDIVSDNVVIEIEYNILRPLSIGSSNIRDGVQNGITIIWMVFSMAQ